MNTPKAALNRRSFLQLTGALGLGALVAPSLFASSRGKLGQPALRKFGRSGIEVSELGLGAMYDTVGNPVVLQECYEAGVHYWDTAASYAKGQSEIGIGRFFEKNSGARKKIFLVTKASRGHSPEEMSRLLAQSLERMKTDYVDLYFMHGMDDISQVNRPEVKAWAEAAKKSGKIRLFGFSTHKNMEPLMTESAKLGWIDGIMMTYNYRNMAQPAMQAAVEACAKAGIGLTAMKTMALDQRRTPEAGQADAALEEALAPLTAKGFTPGQAKIKAVLSNKLLSSACVQMPNLQFFQEAFAAVTEKGTLTAQDRDALRRHAEQTCNSYCAGCAHLCEGALAGTVPVRDVLRYQMYHAHYGMEAEAREKFAALPQTARDALLHADYQAAEAICPNRLPLASLMRQAHEALA